MRGGTLSILGTLLDRMEDLFAVIASILVAIMTILICVAVISRYLFASPMVWVQEMTEYTLLLVTFLAAPWLARRDGHVRVDIILAQISPRNAAFLKAWGWLLAVVACFGLVWYGTQVTYDNYVRGTLVINMLRTPMYILLAIIPLGSLLLTIEGIRLVYRNVTEARSPGEATKEAPEQPAFDTLSL